MTTFQGYTNEASIKAAAPKAGTSSDYFSGDRGNFTSDSYASKRPMNNSYESNYSDTHSKRQRDDFGKNLAVQHWDMNAMPKFEKNFYKESAEVAAMTESQISAFRAEASINVIGKNIPKPVPTF